MCTALSPKFSVNHLCIVTCKFRRTIKVQSEGHSFTSIHHPWHIFFYLTHNLNVGLISAKIAQLCQTYTFIARKVYSLAIISSNPTRRRFIMSLIIHFSNLSYGYKNSGSSFSIIATALLNSGCFFHCCVPFIDIAGSKWVLGFI